MTVFFIFFWVDSSFAYFYGGFSESLSPNFVFFTPPPPQNHLDYQGFKMDDLNLKVDDNGHLVAGGERQGNENKRIRFEQSYKVPENSSIEDATAKFEDEILFIVIPKAIKPQKEPHPEITNVAEAVQEEKGTGLDVVDMVPQAVLKEEEEEVKGKNQHIDATDNGSRHESESASHNHHGNEEISDKESEEEEDDDTKEEEETAMKTTTGEDFHDAKMDSQSSLMEKLGEELKKNKRILITAVLAFSLGVIVTQKFLSNEK